MMGPATTTPTQVRAALLDLALVACAHLVPGAKPAREPLKAALHHANEVLKAEMVEVLAPEDIRDPEQLVLRFIASGGTWRDLVAAVNRNALIGATGRPRSNSSRGTPPAAPGANAPCRRDREQETRP